MSKNHTSHWHKEQEQMKPEMDQKENIAEKQQDITEKAESELNQSSSTEEQAAESSPEEKIAALEAKSADLAAQLAEMQDQFLRKAADFENFRKRMNQEKASAIEFANQTLLLDLIPIIDDFERAIIAGETTNDMTAFLEGVKMIEKRLTTQLEAKWGLKRFNSVGEPFDPNLHEALFMEKSPDVQEAVVQEDMFKGYYLKDRVIRAAKVKVLMPEDGE